MPRPHEGAERHGTKGQMAILDVAR